MCRTRPSGEVGAGGHLAKRPFYAAQECSSLASPPLLWFTRVTHTRSLAHWPFFSSIDTNVAFIIEAAFCLSLPLAHAGRYCEA